MSIEIKTTIPNYSDAYDKAQQYIKLALAIVYNATGTNTKLENGAYRITKQSDNSKDCEGEFIIPKRITKMSIPEIKAAGIDESIQQLKEIEQFSRQEMLNATFGELNDALKKHNIAAINVSNFESEFKEP